MQVIANAYTSISWVSPLMPDMSSGACHRRVPSGASSSVSRAARGQGVRARTRQRHPAYPIRLGLHLALPKVRDDTMMPVANQHIRSLSYTSGSADVQNLQ